MSFKKVIDAIQKNHNFIVTSHANPDGDALGSMLALGAGLKFLGKKVKIYSRDGVPKTLAFLPNTNLVSRDLTVDEPFDAGFIVDCAEKERVGDIFRDSRGIKKLIVVDHHLKSGRCGDINLIDAKAPSTGELVYRLLKKLKVPISKEIAVPIYCTLVTDTGGFRYSNTNSKTLKTASELVRLGAEPWFVSKNVDENYSASRFKVLGKVLETMTLSPEGHLAYGLLTRKMLSEAGAAVEDAEGFINFFRSIGTVEVAVQFREESDNLYKVSFRSKDRVDVAAVANQFGGGGHARASGCTLKGSLQEVQSKILKAVEQAFKI
ncbi:MAG: bifunctional oligoribonuclease/PAP phosphatase NrnA [Deltaproteobacteria bacterium]|nr:bifunctional oligoribonuclease/PAP phosphatase NrnA [Deltaproteobacteria bacterium]